MKKQKNRGKLQNQIKLLVFILLCSCNSNAFDVTKNGCIIGKDKSINYLTIYENGEKIYDLQRREGMEPPKSFCLDNIPTEYYILKEGVKEEQAIKIKNNREYRLEVWGGDAAPYSLTVYKNSQGNYIKKNR